MPYINKTVNLLSRNNPKTVKGEKYGYRTYILYMSSHKENSKGINICPFASKGCIEACLVRSGNSGMFSGVYAGRINKTEWFLSDRVSFLNKLVSEIESAVRVNKGKYKVAIRLNGTSDISWEKFKIKDNKNIFELFPKINFYDYTKNYTRFEKQLPTNYHLTFSRDETNEEIALSLLERGINVSMVFAKTLPQTYKGYKVVNGDENDLTFVKEKGIILGLKYKYVTTKGVNNKKIMDNGFIIHSHVNEEIFV